MSEKEYTVIVKDRSDLPDIETELTATSGSGPIPSRKVDIVNPRPGSTRQTHFALTEDEASALSADSRILSVEIPPEQRDDISIELRKTQTSEFTKPGTLTSNLVNWGLRRCNWEENEYGNSSTAGTNKFEYAVDGDGVDVVIQDSGIQVGHPEWLDEQGGSRLRQIDWYTESGVTGTQNVNHYRDHDGHGTHCAGISAVKTYGWAKNSAIYAQKVSGLEGAGDAGTGISVSNVFDTIRLWHNNKPVNPVTGVKRPTIVNMSWGYGSTLSGDPVSGNYRGTGWTWPTDYSDNTILWTSTGIVTQLVSGGTARRVPLRVPSVDTEVDDMISDGIHVCIAAGNDYHKGDLSTGTDYNNTVVFGSTTYYYHRGSSPHSDNAFIVGNIDSPAQLDGSIYRDRPRGSSSKGARVQIWAPGSSIVSACSNIYDSLYAPVNHPDDAGYKIMSISGTSMASPQVCGLGALHLGVEPTLTPAQLKAKIIADAKNVIFDTGADNDYGNTTTSLMGASNNMLFNRYNRQPYTTRGGVSVINTAIGFKSNG